MGSYATTTQVRALGGFTTSQLSDTNLEEIITLTEKRVDSEVEVSLSADQKTLATIYLTCAAVMERLATGTISSDGVRYTLDRLMVDDSSTATIRNAQALKFYEQYRATLRAATTGTDIVKRVEG